MQVNRIYNENCLDTMGRMPDEFIDLTVTSPPYDNLRDYKGYSFDFEPIAQELFRVTKTGGVVVWIVNDATVKGSETGTSFKQALYFKEIGFRLHDTMIYAKSGFSNPSNVRYHQVFEYMFIFSNGRPSLFNGLKDRQNKYRSGGGASYRTARGEIIKTGRAKQRSSHGLRFNIWRFNTGGGFMNSDNSKHPAQFPEQLASDHIISWSNPGDLVFDPFSGSGTTAKMALLNGRDYIGSEIAKEYCQIAEERIQNQMAESA